LHNLRVGLSVFPILGCPGAPKGFGEGIPLLVVARVVQTPRVGRIEGPLNGNERFRLRRFGASIVIEAGKRNLLVLDINIDIRLLQ
jgi:hypothetical protein